MSRSASALVGRAEALSSQAIPEYQDLTLVRLPPNLSNGLFFRFDYTLHAANIVESRRMLCLIEPANSCSGSSSKAGTTRNSRRRKAGRVWNAAGYCSR